MGNSVYLEVLIILPAFGALVVALCGNVREYVVRQIGFVISMLVLALAVVITVRFHATKAGYQMVVNHPWVRALGISWHLGIDGISLFLVLLTALLFPICLSGKVGLDNRSSETLVEGESVGNGRVKSYVAWMLLLEAACLGSFLSLDLIFFFLFFELTLIPGYFVIARFGHERKVYAAVKFFVYTFFGSTFLFVGILAVAFIHQSQTGVLTFSLSRLASTHFSPMTADLLFLAFSAAFAVKAPIFPFHTWSPDAYSQAPTGGSIVLAGVMAKLGVYGIIRFDLGLFPKATVDLAPLLLTLAVIGILYGAIVAASQRDFKNLVAYSSLSHMGFIVLGIFALSSEALTGGVLEMFNHGIYTAGLFLLLGIMYRRSKTSDITKFGGLQQYAPVLAGVFTLVMLATVGLPGLNGFVGEFLILLGTFQTHRWWAVVAATGVIFSVIYLLFAYQRVFHGQVSKAAAFAGYIANDDAVTAAGGSGDSPAGDSPAGVATKRIVFRDLTWTEGLALAPLVVLIVFLGIYPRPVLERITPSVDRLVTHVVQANRHANLGVSVNHSTAHLSSIPRHPGGAGKGQ
ncbi:MAG: NADH-quinone oxidoreductase subunit M [Actinobacteria bacterium]|nr:NADH-quinone oxidoreductase subunit M [Actinomycetota bacterium]MCL6105177.1 NADH-quinone oxidoreductase subunit M [Actinomycetota bacterium]